MLGYIIGSDLSTYDICKDDIEEVPTEYGKIEVILGNKEGEDIVFLPRHGISKKAIPSLVNYIGNITALKKLGVDKIVASFTTGAMEESLKLGKIYGIVDFIDLTRRPKGIGTDVETAHVDMHEPFCVFFKDCIEREVNLEGWVVYACTEGPRFETKAEINMLKNYADVVGMTLCPEAVIAKEMGICYYGYTVPVNYATGIRDEDSWGIKKVVESSREALNDFMLSSVRGYKKIKGIKCPICER